MYRLFPLTFLCFAAVNIQESTSAPVDPGNCDAVAEIFRLENEHSILVDSLYAGCKLFPGNGCADFEPFIKRIDEEVVRNGNLKEDQDKIDRLSDILLEYIGHDDSRRDNLRGLKINNGWGMIGQLASCQPPVNK
uniref:Secreted protein n=1 Tax=Steinernema glaseri TaxID=37863 RepID=A0A1I7YMR7_9BILA